MFDVSLRKDDFNPTKLLSTTLDLVADNKARRRVTWQFFDKAQKQAARRLAGSHHLAGSALRRLCQALHPPTESKLT
eukprot:235893-Amphidinium_carterae.1